MTYDWTRRNRTADGAARLISDAETELNLDAMVSMKRERKAQVEVIEESSMSAATTFVLLF